MSCQAHDREHAQALSLQELNSGRNTCVGAGCAGEEHSAAAFTCGWKC